MWESPKEKMRPGRAGRAPSGAGGPRAWGAQGAAPTCEGRPGSPRAPVSGKAATKPQQN